MKKICLTTLLTLALLPLFGSLANAAGLPVAAGVPNYPLIIACVVGGSLAVFLVAMFAMKYKRKPQTDAAEQKENQDNG